VRFSRAEFRKFPVFFPVSRDFGGEGLARDCALRQTFSFCYLQYNQHPAALSFLELRKCFGRLDAAVSAQNNARFIDQNRGGETEFLDTGLELGQLLGVVSAGVSRPRFEITGPAINKATRKGRPV